MITHYTRVEILAAEIMPPNSDCDLTFRRIEGAKLLYDTLSLDGSCVENRLMPELGATEAEDLIGKEVWIALYSEAGEPPGYRRWEYLRPYKEGDQLSDIEGFEPQIASSWEALRNAFRRLKNIRDGSNKPH